MDFNVSLSEQAEQDIDSAFEWYEKKKVGLGLRFYKELRFYLNTLNYSPEAFPIKIADSIRELPLKVFPYVILFEVFGDEVIVYRIFPTKRNPKDKLQTEED